MGSSRFGSQEEIIIEEETLNFLMAFSEEYRDSTKGAVKGCFINIPDDCIQAFKQVVEDKQNGSTTESIIPRLIAEMAADPAGAEDLACALAPLLLSAGNANLANQLFIAEVDGKINLNPADPASP